MPVELLARTGSGPADFEVIAEMHRRILAEHGRLAPGHHLLDMGCGVGRDALLLLDDLGTNGRYTGFDVDGDCIAWCRDNVTPRHPTFLFHHLDVYSHVYNPQGSVRGCDVRFPVDDADVDRAIAHSLFTHLLAPEAERYLSELRRVLRPDGRALLTFFVATDEDMPRSLESPVEAFRFPKRWSDGVYVKDPRRPEDSVAVTPQTLHAWLARAGLRLAEPIVEGYWLPGRGDGAVFGQDLVVVEPAS